MRKSLPSCTHPEPGPRLHCPYTSQGVCSTILSQHGHEASAASEAMPYHDAAR